MHLCAGRLCLCILWTLCVLWFLCILCGCQTGYVSKSLAMSEERDVVAMSAIAERLGKTTGYLSPYRRQLIARQVIEQTAPGYVTFSIPFMREFLQERRGTILARYGE